MKQRKPNEKFVLIDQQKNKYLLKTILYIGDREYHCDECFLNSRLCEEVIDLTGDCCYPNYLIFTCIKTRKYTYESKT